MTLAQAPVGGALLLPDLVQPDTPLLVTVHGISRNASEHLERFAPLAREAGIAVLAPLFDPATFPDYQRLGARGRGQRADLALRARLEDIGRTVGLRPRRIHLFGHSGGGQFVHRYVMAYPDQVERYVVSAAGWYTFPDPEHPFPLGIGTNPSVAELRFDPSAFLRVPGMVVVGQRDTNRGRSLRTTPLLDARQGPTRVDRAERWVAAMNAAAAAQGVPPPLRLHRVPGIGHRFAALAGQDDALPLVFSNLFGTPTRGARAENAARDEPAMAGIS